MFVVPPFRRIPKATGPSFVVAEFRSTSASLLSAGFPTFLLGAISHSTLLFSEFGPTVVLIECGAKETVGSATYSSEFLGTPYTRYLAFLHHIEYYHCSCHFSIPMSWNPVEGGSEHTNATHLERSGTLGCHPPKGMSGAQLGKIVPEPAAVSQLGAA